ncbi:advanced glycosylation end product-specific receptor [Trichomycterus rosablanca]|uniref:advanced glycosylation end product-specific receptor n=1 Tax=Trichomycterus rosablanca TaxID=2290929 RepID=UPI002F35A671
MKGCILLAVVILALLRSSTGSLIVKGPAEPILEGQSVTLECLDSELEYNMSSVHFEKMSRHFMAWHSLEGNGYEYYYRRCFMYDMDINREDGRLRLTIPRVHSWTAGMFRCVADNTTDADNSSEPYEVVFHYMKDLTVRQAGLAKAANYFTSLEELNVQLGDDVELDCSASSSEDPQYFWVKEGETWMVPSSKLKLFQVRDLDSGAYTCTAQHPTVSSLSKKRTVKITVLPEEAAWYESTNGRIYLMASAAGVALLIIIVSMTAFLCRRARQTKSKGPIDDHSQKKPIYRNSVESLTSTAGDNQPLV